MFDLQKAKNFLDSKGADYEDRHIVENNPTAEELKQWHEMSELDIKKFSTQAVCFISQ